MATVTQFDIKKKTKPQVKEKETREFSKVDISLMIATGVVAFGGILFCNLMDSISY
jgi:hypothetical protein